MKIFIKSFFSFDSFADFVPSNFNKTEANDEKELNDFVNIFICHLIFYAVFCISLALHILIDLGLGSFVKNKFLQLIEIAKNTVIEKNPAFAWLKKIDKKNYALQLIRVVFLDFWQTFWCYKRFASFAKSIYSFLPWAFFILNKVNAYR